MKTFFNFSHPAALLFTFLVLGNSSFQAQTTTPLQDEKIIVTSNIHSQSCFVKLDSEHPITNLMVIIWDKNGNLVYHETRFDFNGHYERTIDLSGLTENTFEMKICADRQNVFRSLVLQ